MKRGKGVGLEAAPVDRKANDGNEAEGVSEVSGVNESQKTTTTTPRWHLSRLAVTAVALALALLSTGCVSWETRGGEGRVVRATGFHRIKGAALPDNSVSEVPGVAQPRVSGGGPTWAGERLEEKVSVPLSPDANSQIEAMMVARREASDEALRRIGARLAAQTVPEGGTLGDMLDADGALKTRVELVVRSATRFEDAKETAEGTFSLTARLDEALVARQIWQDGAATPGPGASPAPRRPIEHTRENDPVLAQAYALADRQARADLLHRIQLRSLVLGYTIGERMTADPAAAEKVRAAVRDAPVVSFRYPDNESCEVVVELDLSNVSVWLKSH